MIRPGRLALVIALLLAAGCGGDDSERGPVGFGVVGHVDRESDRLTIAVGRDTCSGRPIVPSADDRDGVVVTPIAYVVTVQQDQAAGDCAGTGQTPGWRAELRLPAPLGTRGLVSDAGPYEFREILVPPRGRAAVRSLVLDHHNYLYSFTVCEQVAADFRDLPRDRWCHG